MPKMMAGYAVFTALSDKTNGAIMEPILAIILAVPTPTLRTTTMKNDKFI